MVTGIVDRIEGQYAVVEFTPEEGDIFTLDILRDNLNPEISEGDILRIYSVNTIDFNDKNSEVYRDLKDASKLKTYLTPLARPVECNIVMDRELTKERSVYMKKLLADLFK